MNTPATGQTSEPIDFNASQVCQSLLETTLRNGAQQMLQQAIEEEVSNYPRQHRDHLDEPGHRLVVESGTSAGESAGLLPHPHRHPCQKNVAASVNEWIRGSIKAAASSTAAKATPDNALPAVISQ